ncbi:MAG: endonuclease/exonuclease/phosphatase family protein [Ferruginibacter sp.]
MKIATWNLQRPAKSGSKVSPIEQRLKTLNADILILTETNQFIDPGPDYKSFHTAALLTPRSARKKDGVDISYGPVLYKPGERRASIYSKYNFIEQLPTFDPETSTCIKFQTPLGDLAVYATIIGVFGNREQSFKTDLDLQLTDFENIVSKKASLDSEPSEPADAAKTNLCIAGDLNITFADNSYYTKEGREKLNDAFQTLELVNLTAFIPGNIDHIILPERLIGKKRDVKIWNTDKKISDHVGVAVTVL